MAAILNFRIFAKNAKHKFASISLTVRDRAISSKFLTHRVSQHCTLGNYVHPPGGWIYYFCFFRRPMSDVRRPMSGVTHGFRSFKGKVLELLSPNLVCRLIGSVACLGLLLAVVPLLLTE